MSFHTHYTASKTAHPRLNSLQQMLLWEPIFPALEPSEDTPICTEIYTEIVPQNIPLDRLKLFPCSEEEIRSTQCTNQASCTRERKKGEMETVL